MAETIEVDVPVVDPRFSESFGVGFISWHRLAQLFVVGREVREYERVHHFTADRDGLHYHVKREA